MTKNNLLQSRYDELKSKRSSFVERAFVSARLTIPSIFSRKSNVSRFYGENSSTLNELYSSVGARGVLNLASRLMMAVMPPGVPFFRLGVPAETLVKSGRVSIDVSLEKDLASIEKLIEAEIHRVRWREPLYMALQHLIVTGNILEQLTNDNHIKLYRLDQYCVVRTPEGVMREIIIEEMVNPKFLPEEIHVSQHLDELIPLYTCIKWDDLRNKWRIYQEIESKIIPTSDGYYDVNPFNALRWNSIVGEDYGRSKCDEVRGDLMSVEGLSKALLDGAAMASRNVILMDHMVGQTPTNKRSLAMAKNGDILVGNPESIKFLNFGNVNGMQVTAVELERVIQQVSTAFLLQSGVTRQAERVTKEEILRNAQELDTALGGVYSTLSEDMQANRLNRLIHNMQKSKSLPEWGEAVQPTITTGFEALGRESDVGRVQRALEMLQGFSASGQSAEVLQFVKWDVLLNKAFNGLGISDAVRSEEEVQQLRQQMMAEQATQQIATSVGERGTSADIESVT